MCCARHFHLLCSNYRKILRKSNPRRVAAPQPRGQRGPGVLRHAGPDRQPGGGRFRRRRGPGERRPQAGDAVRQCRRPGERGTRLDENGLALVALGFDTIAQPLRVPGPAAVAEAKTLHAGPGRGGGRGGRHDARRGADAAGVRNAGPRAGAGRAARGIPGGADRCTGWPGCGCSRRSCPGCSSGPRPCGGRSAASTRRPCGRPSSNGWTGRCRCWRSCACTGRECPNRRRTGTRPCDGSAS